MRRNVCLIINIFPYCHNFGKFLQKEVRANQVKKRQLVEIKIKLKNFKNQK